MNKPELTIIDVSAIAWVIKWPTNAPVSIIFKLLTPIFKIL